jgi:c-di-GMP-binding flagellar brake protein YcgR
MTKGTRKYQRYSYIATAALRPNISDDVKPVTVMVQNISQGGMGAFLEHSVDVGTPVTIEVNFISSLGAEVKDRVDGKVSSVTEKDGLYFVGVSFQEELNAKKQPYLYELFEQSIKGD